MTRRAALARPLDPYLNGSITLTSNDKQWTPKLADLGMRIDLDRTVDEAYQAGRAGGPVGQLWRAFEMQHGAKQYVPLYVRVDDQALNSYLDGLQTQLGTPPHDATVAREGQSGRRDARHGRHKAGSRSRSVSNCSIARRI